MDKNLLKRLQSISHRVDKKYTDNATDFLTTLKSKLAERKYRADLLFATAAKNTEGSFHAEIKFNKQLGYPSEQDILTLVAQSYPTHQINWELLDVDDDTGVVTLLLEPDLEVIPVTSIDKIPEEFVSIGAGIYKRAMDTAKKANEVWTLKKDEGGLSLYRSPQDLEVTAEDDDGFKNGDAVNTPEGPGIIKSFDELGNAFVQVGSKTHLIAQMDMKPYDLDKERKQLEDYYAEAYGDRTFAKELVDKSYTRKK